MAHPFKFIQQWCICFLTLGTLHIYPVQTQYDFVTPQDETLCTSMNLVDISPYRSASFIKLPWKSAENCCKIKGKILHTVERNDEFELFPLTKVLIEALTNEVDGDFKFWIGAHQHKQIRYQWTYGAILKPGKLKLSRDSYEWAKDIKTPNPSKDPACVIMEPKLEVLQLRPEQCVRRLKFICQKIEQRGGSPLRGTDMKTIGSAEFIEIPGFDRLKFSTSTGRWPVANAICQRNGWGLIDHVHDRYREPLINQFTSERNIYMFDSKTSSIQTSGNDFCSPYKWEWACSESCLTIPLHKNCTNENHRGDKLLPHTERCLQFIIHSEDNPEDLPPLVAKNVDCDELGYVVCDTTPACEPDMQYRCLHKEPHFTDIAEGLDKEIEKCTRAKFKKIVVQGNGSEVYWVSASQFTWKGADECCRFWNWSLPAPKNESEVQSLQAETLKKATKFCASAVLCDGFWTSTTTSGFSPFSPLRFRDGKTLPLSLYSTIRADLFSYPACGRINHMNWEESQAQYVYAHCLEKNFLVCYAGAEIDVNSRAKPTTDKPDGNINRTRLVKKRVPVEFDRAKLKKFMKPATNAEKAHRIWDKKRDSCPDGTLHKYKQACPSSSRNLAPHKKPTSRTPTPKPDNKAKKSSNKATKPALNTTTEQTEPTARIVVAHQNLILMNYLIESMREEESSEEKENDPYAIQILAQLTTLYSQICPQVPHKFTARAVDLFRKLYFTINPKSRGEIMTKKDLYWTTNALKKCADLVKPVRIMNDYCGEMVVAKNCNCSHFICTNSKYESKLYKEDLLLDIIWKLFEASYSICFPTFTQNMLLHHKFTVTMLDLFENNEMRIRWSNQIERQKYWFHLLGPKFDIHLVNIERCNQANIESAYYHVRISPADIPNTVRMTGVDYEKLT